MVDYKTVRCHFGDVELTKWITITDGFTVFSGADYDPELKEIGGKDGSIFIGTKTKHKVIKVPFWVKYNTIEDYDALQLALSSKKPKMLMFSHIPGRYYLAVQVGDLNFKEIKMNGIETYKRKNGFETEYNFFALDDDGVGWRFYKQFEFQADRNYHNPFSMNRSRAVEIFREEDKFRIYFNGAHHHVTVPSLKGKKSRKIHLAMGTCSDSSKYINYNLFEKVNFEKMGVSHYNNIVNKYQPGDEVIINFENDTVSTKDIDSIQDVVLGSKMISIPPGESELVVHLSSWVAALPDISIDFEERYK